MYFNECDLLNYSDGFYFDDISCIPLLELTKNGESKCSSPSMVVQSEAAVSSDMPEQEYQNTFATPPKINGSQASAFRLNETGTNSNSIIAQEGKVNH